MAAEGYEVIYLGTDLPADEIARAAERSGAEVIVLAVAIVPPVPDGF